MLNLMLRSIWREECLGRKVKLVLMSAMFSKMCLQDYWFLFVPPCQMFRSNGHEGQWQLADWLFALEIIFHNCVWRLITGIPGKFFTPKTRIAMKYHASNDIFIFLFLSNLVHYHASNDIFIFYFCPILSNSAYCNILHKEFRPLCSKLDTCINRLFSHVDKYKNRRIVAAFVCVQMVNFFNVNRLAFEICLC